MTINIDLFPKHHMLIGLHNGHGVLCEVGTEVSHVVRWMSVLINKWSVFISE